eukprot:CAMPEP_0119574022 /NCGR_PEP_ID=MMETSP1352-20130426/45416_1 /TAXON_ID=265584 /ORGANISM="Stauroneis constricta, Strain CCMP1120" /LENGTH=224 /DNA_ID=CAMNT_0007623713 /DNA_START=92 /DNA_END=761 /DNA_ORIENTATION=+
MVALQFNLQTMPALATDNVCCSMALVDGRAVLIADAAKLVDAANAFVGQYQRASLKSEFLPVSFSHSGAGETCRRRSDASRKDRSRAQRSCKPEDLGLSRPWIAHDEHVGHVSASCLDHGVLALFRAATRCEGRSTAMPKVGRLVRGSLVHDLERDGIACADITVVVRIGRLEVGWRTFAVLIIAGMLDDVFINRRSFVRIRRHAADQCQHETELHNRQTVQFG